MKSGKLDRMVTINRPGERTQDEYGQVTTAPATEIAKLRAQLVDLSAGETLQTYGAEVVEAVVFRTRYIDGVRLSDELHHDGEVYDIRGRRELGRREGLELRCERRGE